MQMSYDTLRQAVARDAAVRRVRRLQPAGGPGDKIFPPTYPGAAKTDPARHVTEERMIDGLRRPCVLIDSVQSQANRLEEALVLAMRDGRLALPHIAVDFADTSVADVGVITSLDAPHRIYDAIIRDSNLDDEPFRQSKVWRERLLTATAANAQALLEISPTALVFGAWNSTGEGGGLGAKFPRVLTSEIVGVDVALGARTASRIDPLGIRASVKVFMNEARDWALDAQEISGKSKPGKPSEINHSNIAPSVTEGIGATIDHALHTVVLSLAGLRRLGFGGGAKADAARTLLAALALLAVTEQDRAGYALRSRCDLVPEGPTAWELLSGDGEVSAFTLGVDAAHALFAEAVAALTAAGFAWTCEPLRLTPQKRLVDLIHESRKKALEGVAEAQEAS